MPWPWQSGASSNNKADDDKSSILPTSFTTRSSTAQQQQQLSMNWNDSLNVQDWDQYKDPRTWIPAFAVTTVFFCGLKFYRTFLRRIPSVEYIHPELYRKRRLFGKVTSVGDGDGFHLYHTPGGKWAGWGWLRKIPTDRKALKGNTIPIRLAGVDAPECAHFGRPSQPYATEALRYLQLALLNRFVRAHIHRRDHYDRVVATVYLRRWFFFGKTDIGLEMLKCGLATTYEAKSGAEFGSTEIEERYRLAEAEAKRKNLGLWSALKSEGKGKGWFELGTMDKKKGDKKAFETPGQFKARMRELDKAEKGEAK